MSTLYRTDRGMDLPEGPGEKSSVTSLSIPAGQVMWWEPLLTPALPLPKATSPSPS